MTREIKFRAWLKPRYEDDDDANTMYYDIQKSYDNLGNVKPYDPMTNFDEWLDDNNAIIEQYTGLKDKNGKEIYEGDIMEFGIAGAEKRGIVGYEEDFGSYETYTSKGYIIAELFTSRGKIIGNIHENPELLGGEE